MSETIPNNNEVGFMLQNERTTGYPCTKGLTYVTREPRIYFNTLDT